MEGKLKFLTLLGNVYHRAVIRLQFFPFTLFFVVFDAAIRAVLLRLYDRFVPVGEVTGEQVSLPRNVMLWVGRSLAATPPQYDLCMRLPREAANATLHDAFSILLAFPSVRTIGLYWDSSALADDLLLLETKRGRSDPAVSAYEDLGAPGVAQYEAFLQADHRRIVLPLAALRDGQTLLKRWMGAADVVCLNLPTELCPLADAVFSARPDVQFFHFSPEPSRSTGVANNHSFFGWGLAMHERMALVHAADAYVGSFDELGCTALISGRPAILLGGGTDAPRDSISRGDNALWLPGRLEPTALTNAVLHFLSRHLASRTIRQTHYAAPLGGQRRIG
jgi:hypothetical protein